MIKRAEFHLDSGTDPTTAPEVESLIRQSIEPAPAGKSFGAVWMILAAVFAVVAAAVFALR